MYAWAALGLPCPLCRNSVGSGTQALIAAERPPRRMDLPLNCRESTPSISITYLTAPVTFCRVMAARASAPLARRGGS